MSPRAGGEADKMGNRYEGAWTVRQVLEILCGRAIAITPEPVGELGAGAEFILEMEAGDQAHQVKRQPSGAANWTLRRLSDEGVLAAAREHLALNRTFHFASTVPAVEMAELSDRARRSNGRDHFLSNIQSNANLDKAFRMLASEAYWGADAFESLRGFHVHTGDEEFIRSTNTALAALLLNSPSTQTIVPAVSEVVWDNLGGRLDLTRLVELLAPYDVTLSDGRRSLAIAADAAAHVLDRWTSAIDREQLSPPISRSDASRVYALLFEQEKKAVLVTGSAGTGKSVLLRQVVTLARDHPSIVVIALRLDRIDFESATSTFALGQQLGLDGSPVAVLARASRDQPSLLVLDQLDAVSLLSGRPPSAFDLVAEILRETRAHPQMRVVLASRVFDVENDHRIAALGRMADVARHDLRELAPAQVFEAVTAMGHTPSQFSSNQLDLLRVPFNLVLLASMEVEDKALDFSTSRGLLDNYWHRKRQECNSRGIPTARFGAAIGAIAERMSSRQTLTVSAGWVSDDLADDVDALTSEGVLVKDGSQIAFFHESFFDYAFARRWLQGDETLIYFLAHTHQELFRRSQVRQILTQMREDDRSRFNVEVRALLKNSSMRVHIKEVVLAILRSLRAPDGDDLRTTDQALAEVPDLEQLLRPVFRNAAWFRVLHDDGRISSWLSSESEADQSRAVEVIRAAVQDEPDRVAALLASSLELPRADLWLPWIIAGSRLETSRALLDVVLSAVKAGHFPYPARELWAGARDLSEHRPEWASELLATYLRGGPDWLAFLDSRGRLIKLTGQEQPLIDLIGQAAIGAPRAFVDNLVPVVLEAMRATEYANEISPVRDHHFSYRHFSGDFREVDDAVREGCVTGLCALWEEDQHYAQSWLDLLAQDVHDGAQWIVYEVVRCAAPVTLAGWAAQLLLQGHHRLLCGYSEDSFWATRQLLEAITPAVQIDLLGRLETMIIGYRPEWESFQSAYFSSFTLLSAIASNRLSDKGRARVLELSRKFNREQPEPPQGPIGGLIGSPIPIASARMMDDENWLGAIARYSSDRERDYARLAGGAHELAQVLGQLTKEDPRRFTKLGVRIPLDAAPAYLSSILLALQEGAADVDEGDIFALIRHAAAVGDEAVDRWLGRPLAPIRENEIPEDIVRTILERALSASPPIDGSLTDDEEDGNVLYGGDIYMEGFNSAKGALIESLMELIYYDPTGTRATQVFPVMNELLTERSIAVRACVAELLIAILRHYPNGGPASFRTLVDCDDRLIESRSTQRLFLYLAPQDQTFAVSLVDRYLLSPHRGVQGVAGQLAGYLGLELHEEGVLRRALESASDDVRAGLAEVCARRLPITSSPDVSRATLSTLMDDDSDKVRESVAELCQALRGQPLGPNLDLLHSFIESRSFEHGDSQFLLTLENAAEQIGDLVIVTARRFLEVHATEVGDLSTGASADAGHVAELVMRSYGQAADEDERSACLDLIDSLILMRTYSIDALLSSSER